MSATGKLAHLDSLRGLAAAAVVVSHLCLVFAYPDDDRVPTGLPSAGPATRAVMKELFRPVGDGRVCVTVFFVISGIVLAQGYLRTGRTDDLRAAAVKRYVRLAVPALASVLFACGLWRAGAMHHREAAAWMAADGLPSHFVGDCRPESTEWAAAVREGLWSVFFRADGIRFHDALNGVLWTMRLEFAGSLLVYAYLALSAGHPRASRGALVLAFVTAAAGGVMPALFAVGLWLAYALRDAPRVRIPFLPALILVPVAAWVGGIYPICRTGPLWVPAFQTNIPADEAVPGAAAVVIVGCVAFCPRLCVWLSARPLVWLGKISFGLYLVHMPILLSAGCAVYAAGRDAGYAHPAAAAIAAVVTTITSVFGGWLMYLTADRSSVRLAGWVGRRVLGSAAPVVDSARADGRQSVVPAT